LVKVSLGGVDVNWVPGKIVAVGCLVSSFLFLPPPPSPVGLSFDQKIWYDFAPIFYVGL
jgi:hypothetical protein